MPSINNFFANAYKIKISDDYGCPISSWELKRWKTSFKVGAKNGLAIPTGELNDCVVIDIDLFDLKEITACKFIKSSITMISTITKELFKKRLMVIICFSNIEVTYSVATVLGNTDT